MPPAIDPDSSSPNEITARLAEMFDMMTHLSSELRTTNKVLADTRADQVTLRAAVREFIGTNGEKNDSTTRKNHPSDDAIPKKHGNQMDRGPKIRIDPPMFNGEHTTDWIDRIETYFDYHDTPAIERLYHVRMLMDPPASAWFRYYRANNCDSSWEDFLKAIRHRFDPNYYIDYVGILSNLKQSTSVHNYQAAFETALEKVSGVPEATLISLFTAGLKQSIQRELNIRRPSTLAAVFALTRELEACHQAVIEATTTQPRRQWPPNNPTHPRNTTPDMGPAPVARASVAQSPHGVPVVRVSAAEKAERQLCGLCWYCPDKWIPGHKCSRRFLAFMGGDDDDSVCPEIPPLPTPEFIQTTISNPPVITADVSSVHSLAGSTTPRSLRIIGFVKDTPLQVLLDGGSTHNFIHPTVAEKLSLPLTNIAPFRVYVGNGDSLTCSSVCSKTSIVMQGHTFQIDLFVLAIHGPDIVLGVQWLQTLGKVTHDYANLTVEFTWDGQLIQLSGVESQPRNISFNALTALIANDNDLEIFELIQLPLADDSMVSTIEFPDDLPATIKSALHLHADVFKLPDTLPPSRPWDHKIHLNSNTKPINV